MTGRKRIAGFSLKEFSQPPNCRLPWHEHAHASICFVVSGFYTERARGREQECQSQSMVFKPAAEPHADVFGADNRAGTRALVGHLVEEHGRTRLFGIAGPPEAPDAQERRSALEEAVAGHPARC